MRIFKNRWFTRFARKEKLTDEMLCEAIARAKLGLIDADLGGGLIKQRVARPGRGRSGGYRTIIAYRTSHRAIFAFGFAKSAKSNFDEEELAVYRNLARSYLETTGPTFEALIENEGLIEVICDDQENQ